MALDRTWYNTLIDDSGDGISGSVWDKADVDALMDAIDAELFRIDSYASGFWTPTLGGSSGVPSYTTQTGVWCANGNQITINGRITLASKGSLSGPLSVQNLPRASHSGTDSTIAFSYWGGAAAGIPVLAGLLHKGGGLFTIYKGSTTIGPTPLDASEITALDIIFGGSYHSQ